MKMSETRRKMRYNNKKARNLAEKRSRKSIKSDNLHVPLTPSTFRKIKTSASRSSTGKSGSYFDDVTTKFVGAKKPLGRLSRGPAPSPCEVPENVAVHFASFYQNQNPQTLPHSSGEKASVPSNHETTRSYPKMEFTRQMVYKLENCAGTQQYGQQVSALLDETVESPGFDLKLPPVDNWAPFNKSDDYYPLWYKDPNKIPQITREQFQQLKNKYQGDACETKTEMMGGFGKSDNDSSESEVELETESESDVDISRGKNSSERGSWSSRTLSETDCTDDVEKDCKSLDWGTDVENEESELEFKVADNFEKNIGEGLRV